MVVHQSVGCQLQAVPHYRRSVKKLVGVVTQNGDFDFNSISDKTHYFDLDLQNYYSTSKFEVWGRPIYLCLYTIRADVCGRILILKWLYRCCWCCLLLSSFFQAAVFLYSITLVLFFVGVSRFPVCTAMLQYCAAAYCWDFSAVFFLVNCIVYIICFS